MQAAVVGVPGTGKTYFMVHFLKSYFKYHDFFREYTINSDVLIITNIAGLKFYGSHCWDIESVKCLGKPAEGLPGKYTREQFFTVPNMEKIMEELRVKNIILVLDEVQREHLFPLAYKDPAVLYMFAYHRHIGMHIILGTQDAALMSRGVLAQCEYLAHGKLRSKKIFGSMQYRFTDNKGGYLYDKTLRTEKGVFAAYQSASVDEAHKPKNALLHWIIISVVFFCLAGGLFKYSLSTVAAKSKIKTTVVKPVAPFPLSPVVAPVVPAPVVLAPVSVAPVAPLSVIPPPPLPDTSSLVRVIGITDVGSTRKYLLSDDRIVTSKRKLLLHDVYIN